MNAKRTGQAGRMRQYSIAMHSCQQIDGVLFHVVEEYEGADLVRKQLTRADRLRGESREDGEDHDRSTTDDLPSAWLWRSHHGDKTELVPYRPLTAEDARRMIDGWTAEPLFSRSGARKVWTLEELSAAGMFVEKVATP